MSSNIKIAVAQFVPKPLAVNENFATCETYVKSAAAQGYDLIVLPEYHLTSWVPDDGRFFNACQDSISYLVKYQSLARELNINIVPGTVCKPVETSDGGKPLYFNMAYLFGAGTGEVCGSYAKKNLWHTERQHLITDTKPHLAFDTSLKYGDGKIVRVGLLICWDLAFPEPFRALIGDGADVIIIPSWWHREDAGEEGFAINPDSERLFLQSATTCRAFENTAAIVFCNAGGYSAVTLPIVGPVVQMGLEEGMEVAEIDLETLRVAESNYRIRPDLISGGLHYKHAGQTGQSLSSIIT